MKTNFLITGGTGMVGSEIMRKLTLKGYKVKNLSTKLSTDPKTYLWDPSERKIDLEAFQNIETIIHLAGASITKRWTKKNKKEILDSRIQSTRFLFEIIASIPKNKRPKQIICASAIGIYPSHPDKIYSEHDDSNDDSNDDFLAHVVLKWEKEIFKFIDQNIRVCCVRIGLVLGKNGGVLSTLMPFFKLGIGSPLGNGNQWMPWIHVSDLARQFIFLAENENYQGVFLGVGKESITNRKFSRAIAYKIKRPYFLPPLPGFLLYFILGSKAKLALMSTRCSSNFWQKEGFKYEYPELENALNDLL